MFIAAIKTLVYEYICVILFCVIFQIIMIKKEHKNGHRYSLSHNEYNWSIFRVDNLFFI